jgi:predicted small metal-binding protein
MASVNCEDVGFDCSLVKHGATERGILKQFIEHTESAHKASLLTADVIFLKAAICPA